jgi:hypothetical protein
MLDTGEIQAKNIKNIQVPDPQASRSYQHKPDKKQKYSEKNLRFHQKFEDLNKI